MTYWLAGMKTAPAAIASIGDSLTSDFLPSMQMSGDAVMAFATQGQDSILKFSKTLVSQNVTGPQEQLLSFWRDELPAVAKDAFDSITRGFSTTFSDMLFDLRDFKEGFESIWESLRRSLSDIFSSILNEFVNRFLRGMLGHLRGVQGAFSSAFAGLIPGLGGALVGGAAGGLIPNAGGALTAGLTAGVGGTAAGGAAAGGAGFGATMGALATNPFTIAAAGGLALGLGIWKKGWLRGGEEGIAVNPARDRFLRQFGPPGTGEGSGFHTLASLLTQLTGQPGGGNLFSALTSADTMKEFGNAASRILTLLQRKGVAIPSPAGNGRIPFPASPLPALAAATRSASSAPIPIATVPTPVPTVATASAGTMNLTFQIQAWDHQDMNTAFRDEIIPRIKDALHFNQSGLTTTVKRSVS
jgi:hypothetical protein